MKHTSIATNFPKPLLKALEAKECIIFCGSGLSRWSGLPGWEGLLFRMLDYLGAGGLPRHEITEVEEIIRQGDLLMAASLCAQRMRSADMRAFFDEVFIDPNPRPHEVHTLIVSLGPDSYVTTNYDRLIDDAYQSIHGGLALMPVNNDQPVEHARIMKHGASRFIFTPHGRAEKIDTVVLYVKTIAKSNSRFQASARPWSISSSHDLSCIWASDFAIRTS